MKKSNNNIDMLTASSVANALDISVKTLTNWYKWYQDDSIEKPENFPKLPEYIQYHKNSPRYWTNDDLKMLKKFQEWLPRGRKGVMGDISCKYYRSQRGDEE
jgi:hypothetical protein